MLIRFEVPSVDQLFEPSALAVAAVPNADVIENEEYSVVLMEMPGVEKSSVKVVFERGILTVTGERKPLEVPEKARIIMQEQVNGVYSRSMRVHHPVEASSISATLENGLLRIVLPKAEIAKPRVIEVR